MPRKKPIPEDRKPRLCACDDPKKAHAFAPLTKGYVVLVSKEDIGFLEDHLWAVKGCRTDNTIYAKRTKTVGGKKRTIYLHREVMAAAASELIDHKNGLGLDNRRANLRAADHKMNGRNSPKTVRKGRKYDLPRGVSITSKSPGKPYQVRVRDGKRQLWCGSYACPVEAARAYDAKARELHGEFATLNNL